MGIVDFFKKKFHSSGPARDGLTFPAPDDASASSQSPDLKSLTAAPKSSSSEQGSKGSVLPAQEVPSGETSDPLQGFTAPPGGSQTSAQPLSSTEEDESDPSLAFSDPAAEQDLSGPIAAHSDPATTQEPAVMLSATPAKRPTGEESDDVELDLAETPQDADDFQPSAPVHDDTSAPKTAKEMPQAPRPRQPAATPAATAAPPASPPPRPHETASEDARAQAFSLESYLQQDIPEDIFIDKEDYMVLLDDIDSLKQRLVAEREVVIREPDVEATLKKGVQQTLAAEALLTKMEDHLSF